MPFLTSQETCLMLLLCWWFNTRILFAENTKAKHNVCTKLSSSTCLPSSHQLRAIVFFVCTEQVHRDDAVEPLETPALSSAANLFEFSKKTFLHNCPRWPSCHRLQVSQCRLLHQWVPYWYLGVAPTTW